MVGMDVKIKVAKVPGKKAPRGITGRALKRIVSLPLDVRRKKVLTIRRQLAEGKYGINKHMNVAIDKLLEELFGRSGIER